MLKRVEDDSVIVDYPWLVKHGLPCGIQALKRWMAQEKDPFPPVIEPQYGRHRLIWWKADVIAWLRQFGYYRDQ